MTSNGDSWAKHRFSSYHGKKLSHATYRSGLGTLHFEQKRRPPVLAFAIKPGPALWLASVAARASASVRASSRRTRA